jgi:hypothetical protein
LVDLFELYESTDLQTLNLKATSVLASINYFNLKNSDKYRDHYEDLGTHMRIILKWICQKHDKIWTGFSRTRIGASGRLFAHNTQTSSSTECSS